MEALNEPNNEHKVVQSSGNIIGDNKKLLITIGIALLLIIIVWVWKNNEISNIRTEANNDYQELKVQAKRDIVTSREEQLKLMAKPYVWAVRTEMMNGNIDQLNLYALDMIKEKNIMRIVIANDSGTIISSTNKKDEGKPFSSIGESLVLNNNAMVENIGDSILIVTSPIMGFNKRIGTLFIKYAIQFPDLK